MSQKETNYTSVRATPTSQVKLISEKDKIIRLQAKRIEILEGEVEKLRKDRDSLSTKVTLLSYKLQLNHPKIQRRVQLGSTTNAKSNSKTHEGVGGSSGGGKGRAAAISTSTATPVEVQHCSGGSINNANASRQRNASGNVPMAPVTQRQRSCKRGEDEDKLRRSRGWAQAYELSQDLHDKQLEMLERKYGGALRARRAARVIQNAYRQHCMTKNFARLRCQVEEKRLSRRLSEFGRSKTIWTDMVVNADNNIGLTTRSYSDFAYNSDHEVFPHPRVAENATSSYGVHTHSQSYSRTSSSQSVKVIQKSKSMSLNTSSIKDTFNQVLCVQDRKPLQRSFGLDLSTIKESAAAQKRKSSPPVSPGETNNNRNSYPELNDSSASDSPQDTPVEPTVDLPSVNFENLLESKETDILNDSFHSDSSQDTACPTLVNCNHSQRTLHHSPTPHVEEILDARSTALDPAIPILPLGMEDSFESTGLGGSVCSDTGSVASDIQIRVDEAGPTSDGDRTPTQDNPPITKVYANTEVRMRRKQRSGDEAEVSEPVIIPESAQLAPEASPIWKRKSAALSTGSLAEDVKRMSNISEASEPESLDGRESREGLSSSQSSDTASIGSGGTTSLGSGIHSYQRTMPLRQDSPHASPPAKVSDRQRKRLYRIGLNLFNKKPDKGIRYLIDRRFIDDRPCAVAKFLIARKGLSRQMIGEFLGNIQKQFNIETLESFTQEIDLSGLQVDMALRKFQSFFRMPGEAQKIERLMEAFASHYTELNPDQVNKFQSPDTIFLLAFAIIMLNTDLHNKSIKQDRRMKPNDFIKNLRGLDDGHDIDRDLLIGIYERIKQTEFKPSADHVSQVMKVEQMIIGKKPLSLSHRRLVCYCRLYEVHDPNKREKIGLHQREVFLFNDMFTVTKIFSKKKNNILYSFRQSFPLCGMQVYLFETPHYHHGIRLTTNIDGKVLITFNARNEHDRTKFVEDLKEAVQEMNEMEGLRIEEELQKQKMPTSHRSYNRHSKDSGVVDIELLKPADPASNRLSAPECPGLKKNALSNSLIDLADGGLRRGSGGSLDSGMASTASGCSAKAEDVGTAGNTKTSKPTSSRFSLFGKKNRSSKASLADSSEV